MTRPVATIEKDERKAVVKFDIELNEYTVRFYVDSVYQEEADYFTDDRPDAMNTALNWANKKF